MRYLVHPQTPVGEGPTCNVNGVRAYPPLPPMAAALVHSFIHSNTQLLSTYSAGIKSSPANAADVKDTSLIPSPGEGNGNPLHYSCLENPMDRRAWQFTVHRVAKSHMWLKRLSTHTHHVSGSVDTAVNKTYRKSCSRGAE